MSLAEFHRGLRKEYGNFRPYTSTTSKSKVFFAPSMASPGHCHLLSQGAIIASAYCDCDWWGEFQFLHQAHSVAMLSK